MNTPMEYHLIDTGKIPASVHVSRFPGASGPNELQFIIRPTAPGDSVTQLDWVERAYRHASEMPQAAGVTSRHSPFRFVPPVMAGKGAMASVGLPQHQPA